MGRVYTGCWTVILKYRDGDAVAFWVSPPDTYEEAEKLLHHVALGASVEFVRGIPELSGVHHAFSAKIMAAPAAHDPQRGGYCHTPDATS